MDLSRLNPPQREAVVSTEGPLLVLAGAGSGKTRVITHRIVHLLDRGVPARSILAVTFTNKAASEMKERVVHLAGRRANAVTLSTFHAFGADVLRGHIFRIGWPKKFAITDTGDQLAIIRRAMRERQIDDRAFDARKVLVLISRAKNSGKPPEPKAEGQGDDYDLIASEVFPLYQLALKAMGAVDFDDLIVLPTQLFRACPDVAELYRARFRYLMVDEFQDTNHSQLELLTELAGERRNVCAVGDDDQCIYSWRGAEVENILHFERHFPGAKEVRLEQNYRSSPVILDASNAVIEKNPARRAKRMWTDRTGGAKIRHVTAPTEEEEARFVGREIQRCIAEGVPADDIAVLYRTNGQARPIEESLRERGIAYEVIGGSEFFDRREVKDVIAYLKVIANPRDEVSLLRIVNVPARGIGDVTMERLRRFAHESQTTVWDAMTAAGQVPDLSPGTAAKVADFQSMVTRYRDRFSGGALSQSVRALLDEIGFHDAARLASTSAKVVERKLQSVNGLLASVEAYENREEKKADLLTYLNRLSLDSREEEEGPSQRRVALMTLHSAKGLEYRWVFLIGVEEDLLPHGGMQGEPQNLEEERRLCYVGMTRAKEMLVLSRAAVRVKRGKEVPRTPSRFLQDIPEALIEVMDLDQPPPGPPSEQELNFFARMKEKFKAPTSGPPRSLPPVRT